MILFLIVTLVLRKGKTMKYLFGGALLFISLLTGCVATTSNDHSTPIVSTGTVLACPAGTDCSVGGQSAVRVTVDEYGTVRGQAVIEQWSSWGDNRPPIEFEPTQRRDQYRRHSRHYGLNDLQRAERRFGIRNKCYTYRKQNGEPACL
jgi:hypothetical protein